MAMDERGEIIWREGKRPLRKSYAEDYRGRSVGNLWTDINNLVGNNRERTGYPTQKPLVLLERIILASSNADDRVLDPFCGSGTTLVAAMKHERQAMGIDINPQAIATTRQRLQAIQPAQAGAESLRGWFDDVV